MMLFDRKMIQVACISIRLQCLKFNRNIP
jgi:hypothetical protein